MTRCARGERAALCETFERVGPDAPTLCRPWRTRDLAAHIVVRERRPDAAFGIWLRPLERHNKHVMDGYAGMPWGELVDLVRSGPPPWWFTRVPVLDERTNLPEFYIHHEDVLRAQPGWQKRERGAELEAALWHSLSATARLMFRRVPVGVVLVTPSHGRQAVKAPTARGTVVLRGEPGELMLLAYGRRDVADVAVTGSDDAVTGFGLGRLGIT